MTAATSSSTRDRDGLWVCRERYGGFRVRRHPAADGPPYDVDDGSYQRFDAKHSGFSRMIWDDDLRERIAVRKRSVREVIASNKRGYRREDYALMGASWTVANAFQTGSSEHGGRRGHWGGLLPDGLHDQ